MKASLILLFATVIPFGWVILGAIALWRFLMIRYAKAAPEHYLLSLLARYILSGERESRFGLPQFKQPPANLR